MELQFCLPSPEYTVQFIIPKSLSKEGWLMCPACGLPQPFYQGCCFDPDCYPHVFRVDLCPHCGFDLRSDVDPKGYDVEKGKTDRQHESWHGMQNDALEEYAHYCQHPEYPDGQLRSVAESESKNESTSQGVDFLFI